ncbi:MAG TPA: ABC transporter ATP-binding protein [Terriglobales bacterium]|nr:ABC transporter ATP-binding protein [Terriglobales bacterium]
MTPLLHFADVSFSYGERLVLDGIEFSIAEKSCVALIGPNGIGKTTLLQLAAGMLSCSSGTVWFNGCRLNSVRRMEAARQVALVPQHVDVPFEFTVEQIVEQGRTPYLGLFAGLTREDRRAVERAMEFTDITSLRNRVFNELSGGERQRVKVALALAQQPRLLLLDEPTQNLDLGRRLELLNLIHSLNQEGVTILASMHDLQLIEGTFSSVLLLNPDRRLVSGSAEEILRPGILESAFDCPPRHGLMPTDEPKILVERKP